MKWPERRTQILEFLDRYVDQHGYAPSTREIGIGVGIRSNNTVSIYTHRLLQEGRIHFKPNVPRSLVITGGHATTRLPVAHSKPALRPIQRKLLNYLSWYIGKFGYAPSMREIGLEIDRSITTVKYHVDQLVKSGHIRRTYGGSRAISLS